LLFFSIILYQIGKIEKLENNTVDIKSVASAIDLFRAFFLSIEGNLGFFYQRIGKKPFALPLDPSFL